MANNVMTMKCCWNGSSNQTSRKRLAAARSRRPCSLCGAEFNPQTLFDRFCPHCKMKSELLRFSEWLPEVDADIQEKISA